MTIFTLISIANALSSRALSENTADVFVRWTKNNPPIVKDFASYYEENRPCRPPLDCAKLCKHRGVSIRKVVDERVEAALKQNGLLSVKYKPKVSNIYCKFKLKENAGMVWPTPSAELQHCTLLKSDQFSIGMIDVIEVISL